MKTIVISLIVALLAFAAPVQAKNDKKTADVEFKVELHCHKCIEKITENVGFEKGVKDLQCDLAKKSVKIVYDPRKTNVEKLEKAIEKLGYEAEVVNGEKAREEVENH